MTVLQQPRQRRYERERRARRRRRIRDGAGVLVLALAVLLGVMAPGMSDHGPKHQVPSEQGVATAAVPSRQPHRSGYGIATAPRHVYVRFKLPVASGLLFDVRSGRVLWAKDPTRRLPIASLTKMMTALVVVAHARPTDRVLVTRQAIHYSGSGIGLLPLGKRVPLLPLLYGLLLPSGNDAAIALAQHVASTQARFVATMNAQARAMGLGCTHFTSVSGIVDKGNSSCAEDLAVLAHAVLEQPLLRRIVASRSAVFPFPIKARKLFLYNNNPLMYMGYPGVDGVKTGYTVAAGQCLVAAARRGRAWYGVVLLHSGNPAGQAQQLLDKAFARG